MKTDTKDELRLANALLTEHIVNLQDRITTLESHNRDLLAANQVMREALQALHDDVAEYQRINNIGGYDNHCMVNARNALKD